VNLGRVYDWRPEPGLDGGGSASLALVGLANLHAASGPQLRLRGRYVVVRNAGILYAEGGAPTAMPLGDAEPDPEGNFLFQPGRGGGRLDKTASPDPDFRWRYVQASRFGEVNTYYHLDRAAAYVDEILRDLGAPSLPRVTALVNAHGATVDLDARGRRDGVAGTSRWLPFQGGHYRLPGRSVEVEEHAPVSPDGEIHLGPGWRLQDHGALASLAGGRYRANASHNPGILYHEYGHHLTRHTADLSANRLRAPDAQDNRKTDLDEGMCDYLAATQLGTPHIWAFHHRHDEVAVHPRSLVSKRTMADFIARRGRDKHANGTIWAAALWDARAALARENAEGARLMDCIVVSSLLRLGRIGQASATTTAAEVRHVRSSFVTAAAALLGAAADLCGESVERKVRGALQARGLAQGLRAPTSASAWAASTRIQNGR
jgi:hypothetical protein